MTKRPDYGATKRGRNENASARVRIEVESAFKVSLLLRREFGLSVCDAEAALGGGSLAVRLHQALTPIGRLIARTEGGGRIIQGAYEVMYEDCQGRLHTLVARIVGQSVHPSRIEVDAAEEDVVVRFDLNADLSCETNGAHPGRRMGDA